MKRIQSAAGFGTAHSAVDGHFRACVPCAMPKPYIHGFSNDEQSRLIEQARVLAPMVFSQMDFSNARDALEIGCGVGAELKIIHERWPRLRLTGLDWSETHLAASRAVLSGELPSGHIRVVRADAGRMPFPDRAFDVALTIWMLEHAPEPERILREALRVLKPGGLLVCTEVDNSTFGFDPQSSAIAAWWNRFNEYQRSAGGDPFVGKKLEDVAKRLPCRNIRARVLPIISSRHQPERRRVLLDYLQDLLLSGYDNMVRDGMVEAAEKTRLVDEFERIKDDPNVNFQYHAVRLTCRAAPGA